MAQPTTFPEQTGTFAKQPGERRKRTKKASPAAIAAQVDRLDLTEAESQAAELQALLEQPPPVRAHRRLWPEDAAG